MQDAGSGLYRSMSDALGAERASEQDDPASASWPPPRFYYCRLDMQLPVTMRGAFALDLLFS